MAGFLKKKLMEDLTKNGENGELTVTEVRQTFKRFRLTNKDFFPICKELEREGIIRMRTIGTNKKFGNIKIKILKKLRL